MDEATTEDTLVTAQPDGSFTATISNQPERLQRDNTWVPLDPALHANADGTYSPAASSHPLTLSGGGTGPLATMENDGRKLSLSWSTGLPRPQVNGNSALYPAVLPDVDLKVTASDQGAISEVLIVRSAQAAANPALHQLVLGTDTSSGLTISADTAGNLTAADTGGAAVFHATAPLMWDSTTGSTTASAAPSPSVSTASKASFTVQTAAASSSGDEAAAPAPGAQIAPVGTSITADGDIALTPDADLLIGTDTRYPVYIDPAWVPVTKNSTGYTFAQQAYPSTNHYNDTSSGALDPGVGHQGYSSPTGDERTWYQFTNLGSIGTLHVNSAYLNTQATYAADWGCTKYDVRVDTTDAIGTGTTWNSQPAVWAYMATQPVTGTYNSGCAGAANIAFNVTSAVASDGNGTVTFRLLGDESTNAAFKRFDKKATLTIDYNTPPNTPTKLIAYPYPRSAPDGTVNQGCNTSGSYGWIGKVTGSLWLNADVSDPDKKSDGTSYQKVLAQFHLWDSGAKDSDPDVSLLDYTDAAASGNIVPGTGGTSQISLANTTLKDGHRYGWTARAWDGIDVSPGADSCHFDVDQTAPTISTAAVTDPIPTAGHDVTINVTGADPAPPGGGRTSGIDHFLWTAGDVHDLDGDGGIHVTATSNAAKITYTATTWGSTVLHIAAIDKAGNQSQSTDLSFYVPDDLNAAVNAGDIDGDQRPDLLATNTNGNLDLFPTYTESHTPAVAAPQADSPDGTNWAKSLIAHRLSSTGTRFDDLWALTPGKPSLYIYRNNLNIPGEVQTNGGYYYTASHRTEVPRKTCGTGTACSTFAADWSHVTQLIAPGDINQDGNPDLLTVEDNNLWYFPGRADGTSFNSAQQISGSWGSWRVMAPGDFSADGTPDVWAWNTSSGDIDLFALHITNGTITRDAGTLVGTLPPSTTKLVTSPGDTNGDGLGDLYATTTDGDLDAWHGTATPGPSGYRFGRAAIVTTGGWQNFTTMN
ncbi:FG-GAP-like repeat-containing protein [Streptacidiphilus sp. ASG 303]|uniref:FG-GAP-like repeat-containing protein n=1 Tax=Streptacidiphilus sp. ASG 303 TaxID=2896847 RepID=UPI001E2CEA51|nr:FG-GAP-like repeat-containing protein [Streptacidiphilus sp. ASG 303]MCD0486090.1 FG-GAP-like repeat-containing protein [Streptacidiphilus sp. ASG 303]